MGIWINKDLALRRRELKGTSKNNEQLRLICQIRHEFTNYDKLVTFYDIYPNRRKELNGIIRKLIDEGPDYVETFRKKVKHIEEVVNLNRKEAKKKFLAQEEQRLRECNPLCKEKNIKEWALNNLNKIIRINNTYIQNKRSIEND
ncbi:MAG: hypothetical protein K6G26_13470 [Lachnospiraceae bacterium]|nr:hypothetical protein [Lachnospiraceae bacterium]